MIIIIISDRRDGRSNAESRYLRFRLQECWGGKPCVDHDPSTEIDPSSDKTIRIYLNTSVHWYVQTIPVRFREFLGAIMCFPIHKFVTESGRFRRLLFYISTKEDSDMIKTIRIYLNTSVHWYVQTTPVRFWEFLGAIMRFPVHKIVTPSFSFAQELKPNAFQNEPYPRARQSLPGGGQLLQFCYQPEYFCKIDSWRESEPLCVCLALI